MLKFTRKNKKLVIPVGINPSYNIDSSTLYNVSDADVVANDVIAGKVAYGADGKIVGTLDVESEIATSFENGYAAGQEYGYESGYGVGREEGFDAGIEDQKAKLETITITENGTYNREDGYNEVIVEVPDLNGDYNEGYSDGVIAGREEIITEQSDATITPQTVFKGEIGYGANNEKVVGVMEAPNFSLIGYSQTESNNANEVISNDIAYSKQLLDEWNSGDRYNFRSLSKMKYMPYVDTSNFTSMNQFAISNSNLSFVPLLNTSNVTDMYRMFGNCIALTSIPLFDTSKVTDMSYMFYSCPNLTSVPEFDTSKVTTMYSMFESCSSLTSVPLFNTSNVTNITYMFSGCRMLTTVPLFDTSKVTNMHSMFSTCSNLTSIPLFDTSNVTTMERMFYNCSSLTSIPLFDTSKVTSLQNAFGSCNLREFPSLNTSNVTNIDGFLKGNYNLITIHSLNLQSVNVTGGLGTWNGFEGLRSLENVIALNNFGQGFSGTTNNGITLTSSSKLTKQSCLNIFNTIYNMNLNTAYTGTPTIQLSSTTKALLSADDIAIATSKGWTIS